MPGIKFPLVAKIVLVASLLAFGPFAAEWEAAAAQKPAAQRPKAATAAKKAAPAAAAAAAAVAAPSVLALPNVEPQWPAGPEGEAAKAYAEGKIAKARKIWEELAANGDGQAMNNLGLLYDQGKGTEPDVGQALNWFAKSARAGNPAGMSNYGRMLEQGRGLPANPEEAARWLDLAARQGQAEAQYNLGYLYENGRGVPKDDEAAAAWYSRAASQNQRDALARLGHFYRMGNGVPKNISRAALLLYAAAMEGSRPAIAELETMAAEDSPRAPAVLFGQNLAQTDRVAMRGALAAARAPILRQDDKHICDVYNSATIVPGSNEMAICYAADKRLGFLKIDYVAPDKARADAILGMVENRFGKPTAGEGDNARLWNLGSIIVATQYSPEHKQMSLMYMAPRVYHHTRGK